MRRERSARSEPFRSTPCSHAPLAKPDFRHGNRRDRWRKEGSNARAGFGWLWRGNRTGGASCLDHHCDSYGRSETAEVFDRITDIEGYGAWLQVFFFNLARLQCLSEAIIREFAGADLAMVVARLDDMLPAMWQADYPGNTTPCYAVTR